jgi:pimeloyl-ACP methyl ester carboxylesterase
MKSYVYLHGFASSPASKKARFFADQLARHDVDLHIPDLDGGDFEHLTLSGQLAVIREAAPPGPLVLLGSSLGGYLAALYAERHPEVERLVLLAPAFDFRERWSARLGPRAMAQWKAQGSLPVYHYARQRECPVGYELYEDAAQYAPYPDVQQRALVLQGLQDDVVLPETARHFCDPHANAQLHLLDSGHELTDVLEELWTLAEPFLFND